MNLRIRRGLTRTVIVTGRYAVKIPRLGGHLNGVAGMLWGFARGVLANQGEADWWAWASQDPQQKDKFCPVHRSWLGGIVNVYPRCEPYEVDDTVREAMFQREFFPLDIVPQPSDSKPENYGWLHGKLVILDYDMTFNGCPHDPCGARNRLRQDSATTTT